MKTNQKTNRQSKFSKIFLDLGITSSTFALSINMHSNQLAGYIMGDTRPTELTVKKIIAGLKAYGITETAESLGLEVYKKDGACNE